jgi:uncharacterized membrane protein/mono/diheme cytochrome c family protein
MLPLPEMLSTLDSMSPSWLLAQGGPDLGRAFGRFHPIVVHFPIALAVVAVAAEWWRAVSRRQGMSALTQPLLWIAALSAVAATVTGLVEASSRSGSDDTLELHRWLGIAASAALLGLAWWGQALARSVAAETADSRAQLGSFRWAALVTCGAVGFTGHLGGELVHGKGHLTDHLWFATESVEQPVESAPVAEPVRLSAEEQFFLDKVKPIMEAHCFECHGARKQKGGLRMDTKAWLFNGDAEEWTVLPGKADASLLVERVKLPRTDPDAMPPEGAGLTAEEIAALEKWINDGAAYPVAPEGMSAIPGVPAAAASAAASAAGSIAVVGTAATQVDAATRAKADAASKALAARGVLVQPLALDSPLLDVNASRAEPPLGDGDAAMLADLASLVVNLNLAGSAIGDAGAAAIGGMPNLERLRLDRTMVGDAGLSALGPLPKIESINLVGSKVTAASAGWLKAQASLKRVYVWQTGLDTPEVLKDLAAGGRVQVVGADLPVAQPTTPPMPEDPKPAEGQADAKPQ